MQPPFHAETQSRIVAKASIELDIEKAFSRFTDVAALKAAAQARGVDLSQTRGNGLEVGTEWRAVLTYRRKRYDLLIKTVSLDPPHKIRLLIQAPSLLGHTRLEFKSKQVDLTEVKLGLSAEPKTVGARLKLYAARLAKNQFRRKMTRGLRKYCRILEGQTAEK